MGMILTYKIKHKANLADELAKGMQIAKYVAKHKEATSSKHVTHFGLKSMIACQIIQKYGRNKKIKDAHNIVLPVPNQGLKYNAETRTITVPCLKLNLEASYIPSFEKINQIEFDSEYAYVSVTVPEAQIDYTDTYIGVDLNTTGHCAVAAIPSTGKVFKYGKKAFYTHKKYSRTRRRFQRLGKLRKLRDAKNKESRIVRDLNHKISKEVVHVAKENNCGIKLEELKEIRQRARCKQTFRYNLHSWSYNQLRSFIEYKAKLLGVEVVLINPAYTSQTCSRCGRLGNRNGKSFKCLYCGHVDHADVNAAFNIASRPPLAAMDKGVLVSQLHGERDVCNGSTDTPKEATLYNARDLKEPHDFSRGSMSVFRKGAIQ